MARVSRKVNHTTGAKWRECLKYFILFKKSQGLAERTLADYRYHIELFFNSTNDSGKEGGGTALDNYDNLRLSVMRYFAKSSTLAPITYNTRRKCLKPFFSWLVSEGFLPENPMEGIKKLKEENTPRSVNEEIIRQLLALPDLKTFGGVRDYALLVFTMDTGIRPSEAFGLKIGDFDSAGRDEMRSPVFV